MAAELPVGLQGDLLDDFFAEFDEVLTHIRQDLVQLESAGRAASSSTLESLVRHLHTLKGICGLAGLRSGEQLAHAMEDLLRTLKKSRADLSVESIDILLAAAHALEAIGAAVRTKQPAPDIIDILAQLTRFQNGSSTSPQPEASAAPAPSLSAAELVSAARERGLQLYTVRFTPSQILDQRGINVGVARERLKAAGEILTSRPVIMGRGLMEFEFVVGLREPVADAAAWQADGIQFTVLPPPAAAAEPAAGFDESPSIAASQIVRVDLARLDELMRIMGEMVISRSRLEERISKTLHADPVLKEINLTFARSLREVRRIITGMRMVPAAEIFSRLPFVVRDLSRGSDKKVRVRSEGRLTEIDKFLVERLKEPLLHLVRNAFTHGIESAQERAAAGKPREATIELKARSQGESVIIEVRDDGRGIDPAKVIARARSQGATVPDKLDPAGLLKILCAAGFSTRDEADMAAGRGVGMAVVENTIRELGGSMTLASTPGVGTVFTLKLPLMLSITDALIVTMDQQTCAVPQSAVNEIIQIDPAERRLVQQTTVIPYRGGLLPLISLRSIFNLSEASPADLTVLILNVERGLFGLVVDRVLAQREIVIRPLADALLKVPAISGATELGDGRPVLILNPAELTRGAIRPPQGADNLDQPLYEKHAQ